MYWRGLARAPAAVRELRLGCGGSAAAPTRALVEQ